MIQDTFYDDTPFYYGYSSEEEVISNMNPLLKKNIKEAKGKVIYDIGCGCGRNLLFASKYALKVIGIDLSKKSLEFAGKFVKSDNLELIQGDNLSIPIADKVADFVISDGVCHHTGDTTKAFSECIRILKPEGNMYLAVYKKYRYYPFIYYMVGGLLRFMNKSKNGRYLIENIFINLHYMIYNIFKAQKLDRTETRNIFFDYFITPIATFQSKREVNDWSKDNNCRIVDYARTSGNCHVFIIKKNG